MKENVKKFVSRFALTTSQIGQDRWVFGEVFNGMKNGFFLDLGAHDGLIHSNTYKLEKNFQWKGICVEANPESFAILKKNRRCHCVNVALSDRNGTVRFVCAGEFGGVLADGVTVESSATILDLPAISLVDLLKQQGAPSVIDYLSVDLEGYEEKVLIGFPFDEFLFKCITIERPTKLVRERLGGAGYVCVREYPGMDCYYIHSSHVPAFQRSSFAHWKKQTLYPLVNKLCFRGE